jgi:glycosyltransferase involved in cell wall biosynthesis
MNGLLTHFDKIEAVTNFGRGFLFGRLGQRGVGKIVMRRNLIAQVASIDTSALAPSPCLRLVAVCRLVRQKDLEFALNVVEQIWCAGSNVRYTIYGDGPLMDELTAMAKRIGISDIVRFGGKVSNEKALSVYSEIDAVLMPCSEDNIADADGLPVAFQEALARGCPVFCRDILGVSEFIINGINGWAFQAEIPAGDWARRILGECRRMDRSLIATLAAHQFPAEQP